MSRASAIPNTQNKMSFLAQSQGTPKYYLELGPLIVNMGLG